MTALFIKQFFSYYVLTTISKRPIIVDSESETFLCNRDLVTFSIGIQDAAMLRDRQKIAVCENYSPGRCVQLRAYTRVLHYLWYLSQVFVYLWMTDFKINK